MKTILFIFLQPDPGRWGDPDELPINQDIWLLFIAAFMLGMYTFYQAVKKKDKKTV